MTYLVYEYQYNDMRRPKREAIRFYGQQTLDCLPPTVREMHYVSAINAKDALGAAKHLFKQA